MSVAKIYELQNQHIAYIAFRNHSRTTISMCILSHIVFLPRDAL